MSFAGFVLACWVGIAGLAFVAFAGLGRLVARGDVEANLGIVGDAELRMLVGGREEWRPSAPARLAQFGGTSAQIAWLSAGRDAVGYTGAGYTGAGYTR